MRSYNVCVDRSWRRANLSCLVVNVSILVAAVVAFCMVMLVLGVTNATVAAVADARDDAPSFLIS